MKPSLELEELLSLNEKERFSLKWVDDTIGIYNLSFTFAFFFVTSHLLIFLS